MSDHRGPWGVVFHFDGTQLEVAGLDGARSFPDRASAWAVACADFGRCLPDDVQSGDRIETDEERGVLRFATASGGFSVELVELDGDELEPTL